MEAVARFGLCARKLFISSHIFQSPTPAAGYQCSGVALEKRYFITVRQFKEIGEDSMTKLMKPDGKAASISIARLSKFSGSKEF